MERRANCWALISKQNFQISISDLVIKTPSPISTPDMKRKSADRVRCAAFDFSRRHE